MPLALLVYDLPEEREEFEQAQRSGRYQAALGTLFNKLRDKIRYAEIPDEERALYERVQEWLSDACDQYDVEVL
jgi:hypothetical protein